MMQSKKHVFVLGITGGVGVGKSTVLNYLQEKYHAMILECDAIGKELQAPGGACFDGIIRLFGPQVLAEDGTLDRAEISRQVFGHPEVMKKLTDLVHPQVWNTVQERIRFQKEKEEDSLIVIESAILIEAGYEKMCDAIWFVQTEEKVRRERLKKSRGYTDERIDHMMQSQKPDGFFLEHAGKVIDNSSDCLQDVYEQVDEGLREYGFL